MLRVTVYNEGEEKCGTTVVSGDTLNTAIYLKNVKSMRSCLGGHDSLKKDILHIILHEFCHALDMLLIWTTNKQHKTLKQVSDELENELQLYYGNAKVKSSTYHELWLSCPLEVKAEQFAFRNLAYFWSVLSYKGILAVNHDWGVP